MRQVQSCCATCGKLVQNSWTMRDFWSSAFLRHVHGQCTQELSASTVHSLHGPEASIMTMQRTKSTRFRSGMETRMQHRQSPPPNQNCLCALLHYCAWVDMLFSAHAASSRNLKQSFEQKSLRLAFPLSSTPQTFISRRAI
jgi:hypothetical protein